MQRQVARSVLLLFLLMGGCWQPISSAIRTNFPSTVPVEVKCVTYERNLEQLSKAITEMNQEGWRVMYISEWMKGSFFFTSPHTQICYEQPLRPSAPTPSAGATESVEPTQEDSAPRRQSKPLLAEATQKIVAQLDSAVTAHRAQFILCRSATLPDPPSLDVWVTVLGSGVVAGAQVEGVRAELAVCVERILKTFRISPFDGERSNKKVQIPLQN